MKDYSIWLKSGGCISGTAEERIIKELQKRFNPQRGDIVLFTDEDGDIAVDLAMIEAIAINKRQEGNKMGF